MDPNSRDMKSATTGSQIQFAINLLHAAMKKWIKTNTNIKPGDLSKMDFIDCLDYISRALWLETLFPDKHFVDLKIVSEDIKKANLIRHQYSHQRYNIRRFKGDVKCLENIAKFIGADEVVTEIDRFIYVTTF